MDWWKHYTPSSTQKKKVYQYGIFFRMPLGLKERERDPQTMNQKLKLVNFSSKKAKSEVSQ